MFRILLATDGSDHSKKVIEEALPIAEAMQAEVTIITVVGQYVFTPRVSVQFNEDNWDRINKHLAEEAQEVVDQAAKPFRDKGVKVNTEIVVGHQSPADAICEMAREGDFNLIILGSRGLSGLKQIFLGSVSNKVAHLGCKSVLIVK